MKPPHPIFPIAPPKDGSDARGLHLCLEIRGCPSAVRQPRAVGPRRTAVAVRRNHRVAQAGRHILGGQLLEERHPGGPQPPGGAPPGGPPPGGPPPGGPPPGGPPPGGPPPGGPPSTTGRSTTWRSAAWRSATWRSAAWRSATWRSATWRSTAWRSTAWRSTAWGTPSTTWRATTWGTPSTTWRATTWRSATWRSATWRSATWRSATPAGPTHRAGHHLEVRHLEVRHLEVRHLEVRHPAGPTHRAGQRQIGASRLSGRRLGIVCNIGVLGGGANHTRLRVRHHTSMPKVDDAHAWDMAAGGAGLLHSTSEPASRKAGLRQPATGEHVGARGHGQRLAGRPT